LPRCVWIILLVTASPRPRPTLRVVKNGSEALVRRLGAEPHPAVLHLDAPGSVTRRSICLETGPTAGRIREPVAPGEPSAVRTLLC
jgi:hypothetical protein